MNLQATSVEDARQRQAAELRILVAKMNTTPEDVGPVTEAFNRVLDIAACLPAGQQALIEGLRASANVQEVLSFCRAFVHTMGVAARMEVGFSCVHDAAELA